MPSIGPTFEELAALLPDGITVTRKPCAQSNMPWLTDDWLYTVSQPNTTRGWPPIIPLWPMRQFNNDERAECMFILQRCREATACYHQRLADQRNPPPKPEPKPTPLPRPTPRVTTSDWQTYAHDLERDRAEMVLRMRGAGLTLEDIGRRINVSRERVRQIELRAWRKRAAKARYMQAPTSVEEWAGNASPAKILQLNATVRWLVHTLEHPPVPPQLFLRRLFPWRSLAA
jgi:hypothetical protein